jgi:hypothetical protein
MSGKITVLAPSEPDPLPRLHNGWGRAKRKISTAGEAKTEMSRLYKRCAAGHLDPDDLKSAIWSLKQIADTAERAELEAKIEALEAKLDEAIADGR